VDGVNVQRGSVITEEEKKRELELESESDEVNRETLASGC
jgi:hypothetical protein